MKRRNRRTELPGRSLTLGLNGALHIREERLSTRSDACRLMYVSDIHLRPNRSDRLRRQVIEAARSSDIDAVLLGGDLVDAATELGKLCDLRRRDLRGSRPSSRWAATTTTWSACIACVMPSSMAAASGFTRAPPASRTVPERSPSPAPRGNPSPRAIFEFCAPMIRGSGRRRAARLSPGSGGTPPRLPGGCLRVSRPPVSRSDFLPLLLSESSGWIDPAGGQSRRERSRADSLAVPPRGCFVPRVRPATPARWCDARFVSWFPMEVAS